MMTLPRFIFTACALALGGQAAAAAAPDFGRIPPSEAAVYVQDLHTGRTVLSHRADVSMQPASTIKLVTAFAALQQLGENYRWQTEFKTTAPINNATLQGDVYWVGSGDPVFDQKDLLEAQNQMRAAGIHNIQGQLVFDDSVWGSNGSAADFESDAGEAFATPPSPHMLAYKVVWAKATRNPLGDVAFETSPPLPRVPQNVNIKSLPGSGPCSSLKRYVKADYRGGALYFSGQLPDSCIGEDLFINMFDADEFAGRSFVNQWRAGGGSIDTDYRQGKTPAKARILAVHRSPPLAEVLRDMNKNSNNVIARSVFLTLGAHQSQGKTVQNAKAAVRRAVVQAGLDDEALQLENGSGLSRSERLTAGMMGKLLAKAWQAPFRQAFVDSLPIGGTDGTLKHRFAGQHNLRLKTGTLDNVRALAGYWLPESPEEHPLAIVVLINSKRSGGYLPDMDKLVARIVKDARAYEKQF